MVEIKVPSLGVNDKSAVIVEIVFNEGDQVAAGDVVAVIETTKSTFDIEASESGYVTYQYKKGDEVEVEQTICIIVSERSEIDVVREKFHNGCQHPEVVICRITRKAEIKANDLGVDLAELEKFSRGIIREKDVDNFLKKSKQLEEVIDEAYVGQMQQSFIDSILNEYEAFASLSSEEKIERYRENGAVIGDRVKIGTDSVILSEFLQLMDDASIGSGCYIRTRSFTLGRMSVIGNKANFVAHTVKIGDVSTFGFNVIVSGGFAPSAKLKIGDQSLVSANCLLDAGDGITIGTEVGISPFVKLYTHNHWQSELEGYHSNFGPIVIEDKAYVTGDCLIVPGVTIGQGATVLANSTVIDNVEARTQVCGNPARVIGRIANELNSERRERIMHRLLNEMQKVFGEQGRINPEIVVFVPRYLASSKQRGKVLLTFLTPDEIDENNLDCVIFDLHKLVIFGIQNEVSDEVRNFLRRRGIRFKPIYWRYSRERELYND